jgi:hypothetical protein
MPIERVDVRTVESDCAVTDERREEEERREMMCDLVMTV